MTQRPLQSSCPRRTPAPHSKPGLWPYQEGHPLPPALTSEPTVDLRVGGTVPFGDLRDPFPPHPPLPRPPDHVRRPRPSVPDGDPPGIAPPRGAYPPGTPPLFRRHGTPTRHTSALRSHFRPPCATATSTPDAVTLLGFPHVHRGQATSTAVGPDLQPSQHTSIAVPSSAPSFSPRRRRRLRSVISRRPLHPPTRSGARLSNHPRPFLCSAAYNSRPELRHGTLLHGTPPPRPA